MKRDGSTASSSQAQCNLTGGKCPTGSASPAAAENWMWGGCSVDVKHGIRFARKFVDSAENE